MDSVLEQIVKKLYRILYSLDRGRLLFRDSVTQNLQILYGKQAEEKRIEHNLKKVKLTLLSILGGLILTVFGFLSALSESQITDEGLIERTGYEEGGREILLQAQTEGEKYDLTLQLEAQYYTVQQLRDMLPGAKEALEKAILGENASTDQVTEALNLIDHLPGYPFAIDWSCANYAVLHTDGEIAAKEIPPEGLVTMLTASMTYPGFEELYTFPVHVVPKELSGHEAMQGAIEELLVSQEEVGRTDKAFRLPTSIDGKQITWSEPLDASPGYILLFGIAIGVLVFFVQDEGIKEAMEKRNDSLQADYPTLISKLSIYMASGWTLRLSWAQVVREYEHLRGEMRPAYEEMKTTLREMESGMSEGEAYLRFGHRTQLQEYRKLATLLEQNLKKGAGSLGRLLAEEARLALQEKKHSVRTQGEKISSKLLMPMMLQLGVVMAMILLPAFMAM